MPTAPDDNPCMHLGVKSPQLSWSETNKESLGQAVCLEKSGQWGTGYAVLKRWQCVTLTLKVVVKPKKIFNSFFVAEYFLGRAG